ncbi:hypothetical protein GCM10023069_18750 [Shinella granuli]
MIAEIDADIIAIQEADKRFGERSGLLNLDILERDCGSRPGADHRALLDRPWLARQHDHDPQGRRRRRAAI